MSRAVVVGLRGNAVLAGGLLAGDVSTDRAYRIDLYSGHLTALANLVSPAHDAAGVLIRGAPAVLGGGGSTELSAVQRLRADGRWRVVGRLPGARSDLSAVADGPRVVVVGGYDGVTSPRSILRTTDGRRFRTVGQLPSGVRYAAVAVIGGTAWVFGGEENHQELDSVSRVDLGSGNVSTVSRMPRALGHAAAAVVGSRILVMGGRLTPERPTDAMWWFTPSTGAWRRAGHLPYPVADAAALTTARATYLLGGETPDFTDRVTLVTWAD